MTELRYSLCALTQHDAVFWVLWATVIVSLIAPAWLANELNLVVSLMHTWLSR